MKRSVRGLLVGAASLLVAFVLWWTSALDPLERVSLDLRARIDAPNNRLHEEIALVLVDQNSLDWASEQMSVDWPWPRQFYGAIVSFFERGGAASVSADILFVDDSSYGLSDDQSFGRAISSYGRFVAAAVLGRESGSFEAWPEDAALPELSADGFAPWLSSEGGAGSFSRATLPIPEVRQNAAYLGNVRGRADPDGVYRHAALFGRFDGTLVPTLGVAPYLLSLTRDQGEQPPISVAPGRVAIGARTIPVNREGEALLRYKGGVSEAAYSAAAILQSEIRLRGNEDPGVDPADFEGKHVLLGYSAPGLLDLKPTPLSPNAPGVFAHAAMLDNLLTDDFLRRFGWLATLAILCLAALPTGVAASLVSGAGRSAAVYAVALPVPALAAWLLYSAGWVLPFVAAELSVALSLAAAGLLNFATEGRQKRYIKNAFQQYLSPTVIEQLIQQPDRLRLGGELRELSIFFSDIQGFTGVSERLTPQELTALLNDYLSAMTDIIQEEGGTVDKYEGDAIIAFWNAPLDLEDHAVRAVRAALRCQQRLEELRPEFAKRVGSEIFMRVGLNTGPAVVGNMGSRTRFDYTMLGDAVNLAARLEGINKQFGTFTMISDNTRTAMNGAFPCRELSKVAVVGRAEPLRVYEPWLPEQYEAARARVSAFEDALALYYDGQFRKAEPAFRAIAGEDRPAEVYAARCRELADDPPDPWSGVWAMTEK